MPFEGSIVDTIECQHCGHKTAPKATNFLVLTLNVPQKWSSTLDECMASVLSSETIADYGCQSCRLKVLISSISRSLAQSGIDVGDLTTQSLRDNTPDDVPEFKTDPRGHLEYLHSLDPGADLNPAVEAALPKEIKSTITRTTSFGHLPETLILHLSRSIYSDSATRNNCRVQFSEFMTQHSSSQQSASSKLNLLSSLIHEQKSTDNAIDAASENEAPTKTYRLVAVVRHLGTHSAGHYECYRRKEMFKDYFAREKKDSTFEKILAEENHSSLTLTDLEATAEPEKNASRGVMGAVDEESTPEVESVPETHARTLRQRRHRHRELGNRAERKLYRRFTGSKGWWRISDDLVWEVSVEEVLKQTQNAYLLVYERIPADEVLELKTRERL